MTDRPLPRPPRAPDPRRATISAVPALMQGPLTPSRLALYAQEAHSRLHALPRAAVVPQDDAHKLLRLPPGFQGAAVLEAQADLLAAQLLLTFAPTLYAPRSDRMHGAAMLEDMAQTAENNARDSINLRPSEVVAVRRLAARLRQHAQALRAPQ